MEFEQDGYSPISQSFKATEIPVSWSPHEEQLSGVLVGDLKSSHCPEINCGEAVVGCFILSWSASPFVVPSSACCFFPGSLPCSFLEKILEVACHLHESIKY